MKKIKYIFIIALIFIITGCNRYSLDDIVNSVDRFYGDQYNIKYIESYSEGDITYVTMSADDIIFYVKSQYNGNSAGGLGATNIETSLLSSFYLKNRQEIELIAQKYNLNIKFNEYNTKDLFNNNIIEINANINDINNIKKFCNEVIEIEDIKKIYNLVYGDNTYSYYELEMIGANSSSIKIYNNNNLIKSFTIFDEKFNDETSKINIY